MARVKIQPRNPWKKQIPLEAMADRWPRPKIKRKNKSRAKCWTRKKNRNWKKQAQDKHPDTTKAATAYRKDAVDGRLVDTDPFLLI